MEKVPIVEGSIEEKKQIMKLPTYVDYVEVVGRIYEIHSLTYTIVYTYTHTHT